jgi:hypothetical protein
MNDEKETPEHDKTDLSEKQLVRANEFLQVNPLAPYGQVKAVREMTRRIKALDASRTPFNTGEASHLAQLAVSHNLNPFSGEIWAWIVVKGDKREFKWMPGRRGIIRHANEIAASKSTPDFTNDWWSDERLLTKAEKAELYISEFDMAYESKVFERVTYDPWKETFVVLVESGMTADKALEIGGHPPCSTGIGVLTQHEMKELDKSRQNKMPHSNRCKKRAQMEALKNKFSLLFGGSSGTGGETFDEYIKDSEGTIDVEFEDVTDHVPYGMEGSAFGGKERLNPKFWKGSCEKMVEAELASSPFVAAELLAYSLFIPGNAKGKHLTGFFQTAKDILIEQMEEFGPKFEPDLKAIAPEAYNRLFETKKETDKRLKEKELEEKSAGEREEHEKSQKKKIPDKKEKPDEAKVEPVQEKPKGKTEKKKPSTPKQKKEPPPEPDKVEEQPKKIELTKKETNALVRMAEDYPAICPMDKQDWATAYKYIDLKESGTTRKEFVKLVNDECNADVRLGMAHKLGYL